MKPSFPSILLYFLFLIASRPAESLTTILPSQGPQPSVISPQEKNISLYHASFALAISVASYGNNKSWNNLPNTTKEIDELSGILQKHGFQITRVIDPTGEELDKEISKFLNTHGRDTEARIVVIFSGHGYVDRSNDTAYFVPRDAESPLLAGSNFFTTALAFEDFRSKAMRISAKHGLFVFDNCYSGMIFKSGPAGAYPVERGNSPTERWRYFDKNAKTPVRHFISAGGPDELLPGSSIFAKALIEGLTGAASRTRDGYFTGKELGMFVSEQVANQSRNQFPLSDVLGKNHGDMVFQIIPDGITSPQEPSTTTPSAPLPEIAPNNKINDHEYLKSELILAKRSFNASQYKDAASRFNNIATQLPHWFYPARMAELANCQARNINLDKIKDISEKWTGDDYDLLNCQIAAYRALGRGAQLSNTLAKRVVTIEDTKNFTKKIIIGPTTVWSAYAQWTAFARRDGDVLHLSFTDGWVAGKNMHLVRKLNVGAYLRPIDGGTWQEKHEHPCDIPFDGSSARDSDIFSPIKVGDFQCTLKLKPNASLADVEVVISLDFGNYYTNMFSVPQLAPRREIN